LSSTISASLSGATLLATLSAARAIAMVKVTWARLPPAHIDAFQAIHSAITIVLLRVQRILSRSAADISLSKAYQPAQSAALQAKVLHASDNRYNAFKQQLLPQLCNFVLHFEQTHLSSAHFCGHW
jgi:hypothetical protein